MGSTRRTKSASITALRARALQDETGGFQAFIPLAFHPEQQPDAQAAGTGRVGEASRARRLAPDARQHPAVKAFWIATGVELAQTALWFGVDDLDGTVQAAIYRAWRRRARRRRRRSAIEHIIRAAGRVPVERDTPTTSFRLPGRTAFAGYGESAGACP